MVKYGLLGYPDFFAWLEEHGQAVLDGDEDARRHAIKTSCEAKAKIVAGDERETGQRALLNLGHTFGHAIETVKGYGEWLHGEAVAAGMVIALELSHQLGWLNHTDVERLKCLLQQVNLPISPPADISTEQLLDTMQLDKKVVDGKLRLILLRAIGHAVITEKVSCGQIRQAIAATTSN